MRGGYRQANLIPHCSGLVRTVGGVPEVIMFVVQASTKGICAGDWSRRSGWWGDGSPQKGEVCPVVDR